ncbi:MAG: tRNA 2-thiouridine(34) synthase MnmA [Candidatus Adiutrix sp.]|jgi:tRNA-specific 2-thiouridylase|nr:tRNA 2-thiouridine(34) synthase MnmA [Candidatus Adiutrix sp.]
MKVLTAMSGGIDSSVAALLLRGDGHEVLGATLKLFDSGRPEPGAGRRSCCALSDVLDAAQVADRLNFRHYVFNFTLLFRQEVIRRFAEAYAAGLTPNPCLDCNRYIKFHHLRDRMKALGCDYLATGHYARIEYDRGRRRYLLKTALDAAKDQSYVLYALTQEQMAETLFPLGGLTKDGVRRLGRAHGLENAEKPDSQDICFVENGRYGDFLLALGLVSPPGDFIDRQGRVLGRHRGLIHYTIGQRRRLGVCRGRRLYVTKIDRAGNAVTLGQAPELEADRALVGPVNLISVEKLEGPTAVTVKTRYREKAAPAVVRPGPGGTVIIDFDRPHRALAPGQAAVFYQGDTVLGGGPLISGEVSGRPQKKG